MRNSARTIISVIIIDDHPIVRAGLKMLIDGQSGLSVVGEGGTPDEAVALAANERPRIILLDLDLKGFSGLDIIPDLIAAAPDARILILTGVRDQASHVKALRLGARGVILKDQVKETILRAIEKVNAGEVWLDEAMLGAMLASIPDTQQTSGQKTGPQDAGIESLTKREREIISLVCQGLKNQQIADRLFLSEGTVRNHLTIIYEKVGVSDRFGLIIFASQHGLEARQ